MLTARSRRHADHATRITDATQVKLRNSRKEMTTEISQKDGKVWPNTMVKVIDISKDRVTLTWVPVRQGTPDAGSGQSERFDYVIFAIPPSVGTA